MTRSKFLRILSFFIFPVFVIFAHVIFSFLNFYSNFSWFDSFMHFFGGLSISYTSILFLKLFEERKMLIIKNGFVFVLIVVSLVVLVGVFWEFLELLLQIFFNIVTQPSVRDTITDLLMGLLGGLLGAIFFRKI